MNPVGNHARGAASSAGALADRPPALAGGSDIAPATGQVPAGQRAGATAEGIALAGGQPEGGATASPAGRETDLAPGGKPGVLEGGNDRAAAGAQDGSKGGSKDGVKEGAKDGAKQPGPSSATGATGAVFALARETVSGVLPPGSPHNMVSTGRPGFGPSETQVSANGQVPVQGGADGAAVPQGGARPWGAPPVVSTATSRGASAEAHQIHSNVATAPGAVAGPRAEARAAEIAEVAGASTAQSQAQPTAQGGAGSQPGSAARTATAAQGSPAHGVGALSRTGDRATTGAGEGLFAADPVWAELAPGETRATGRSAAADMPSLPQSVQTPRQVTLQIAEMVRASGERAVELRLQPEELGRVQMTMSQDATGTLTVALTVERPETLDLLRRNIDLLGADLRALGYENVDFSFQGDGAGAGPDHGASRSAVAAPAVRDTDMAVADGSGPQHEGRGAGASGDGIDIRL